MRAARPGVFSLPMVSSFAVRQVSQPQYMKIDRDRPAVNAPNDFTENGSSHVQENGTDVGNSADPALTTAITTNTASTTSWRPTSVNWTPFVAVMPR